MNREIIPYTDEASWKRERAKDITSTTVSALFGLSPYLSKFELWHRLKGGVDVEHEEDPRMGWGKRLQNAIADGVGSDNHWGVRAKPDYMRLPEHRVGSSFDYEGGVIADQYGLIGSMNTLEPDFLVEVKNVDGLIFRNDWLTDPDFGITAPDHIELQAQHECLVAGVGVCYIAALVGGNRIELLKREFQPDVGDAILRAAAEFWALDSAPEPDFYRDAAFIGKLYGYAAPGSVIDADEELAALFREYAGYRSMAKTADDNADAAKAKILTRIGDAERVLHPEFSLSTKMVAGTEVSYTRKPFRSFRLSQLGEKT